MKDANDPETFFALLEKTSAKIETIDTASWDEETLTRLNEAVATLRERLDFRFPRENAGPSTDPVAGHDPISSEIGIVSQDPN